MKLCIHDFGTVLTRCPYIMGDAAFKNRLSDEKNSALPMNIKIFHETKEFEKWEI